LGNLTAAFLRFGYTAHQPPQSKFRCCMVATDIPLHRLQTMFVHLRLHFQLLLAPIFLWGFLLAGGQVDGRFWLAFVAMHLFLYGGTTAYNSYYDRDEGPVGGLSAPPPVLPELLPFSLVSQAIGAGLALLVNPAFLILYLLIFALFTAYSYPGIRLKKRPIFGLLTVALGQGILAGLSGAAAAAVSPFALPGLAWLGIVALTAVTTGFYPITQVYQIEEDVKRGDITFAAWGGPGRTFAFALLTMTLGVLALLLPFYNVFGPLLTAGFVIFCIGLLGALAHWSRHFDPADVQGNYRRVSRLHRLMSGGFLALLVLRLVGIL
jgi:1,4-dihydroxy-2-naphthoate octaprenyltransferase